MSRVELTVPVYGMADTDEAVVLRWLHQPGERVAEGEPVVDIETAKAEVTLESPATGVLGPHLVDIDVEIPTGTVPTWIEVDGGESPHGHHRGVPGTGIDLGDTSSAEAAGWLERMLLIREFESTAGPLAAAGTIPGGMHSAIGHEAVAVGVGSVLRPRRRGRRPAPQPSHRAGQGDGPGADDGRAVRQADRLLGRPRRSHAPGRLRRRLLRVERHRRGRGRAGPRRRPGPVLPGRAAGGGRVLRRRRRQHRPGVGVRQPRRGLAPAAAGRLREQRVRGGDPDQRRDGGESIAGRAAGFGLPAVQVDGQESRPCTGPRPRRAALARSGGGPTFIEALTYRHLGHDIGERGQYRTAEEVAWWERHRDPIERLRAALVARGDLDDAGYEQAAERARDQVAAAVSAAEAAPLPDPATVADGSPLPS